MYFGSSEWLGLRFVTAKNRVAWLPSFVMIYFFYISYEFCANCVYIDN
jgi:hypothetical protein